jgi:hypothetical protein
MQNAMQAALREHNNAEHQLTPLQREKQQLLARLVAVEKLEADERERAATAAKTAELAAKVQHCEDELAYAKIELEEHLKATGGFKPVVVGIALVPCGTARERALADPVYFKNGGMNARATAAKHGLTVAQLKG